MSFSKRCVCNILTTLNKNPSFSLSKDLNVTLGCDFLSVINSSQTSPIHLIDRRVSTTMSRISSSMSKFQRIKFGADLMFSLVKSAFESKEKMRKYLDDIMESDNDMLTEEMLKVRVVCVRS